MKQVYLLTRVLRRMRMYAVEKGQHMRDVGTVISEKVSQSVIQRAILQVNHRVYLTSLNFCPLNFGAKSI